MFSWERLPNSQTPANSSCVLSCICAMPHANLQAEQLKDCLHTATIVVVEEGGGYSICHLQISWIFTTVLTLQYFVTLWMIAALDYINRFWLPVHSRHGLNYLWTLVNSKLTGLIQNTSFTGLAIPSYYSSYQDQYLYTKWNQAVYCPTPNKATVVCSGCGMVSTLLQLKNWFHQITGQQNAHLCLFGILAI